MLSLWARERQELMELALGKGPVGVGDMGSGILMGWLWSHRPLQLAPNDNQPLTTTGLLLNVNDNQP